MSRTIANIDAELHALGYSDEQIYSGTCGIYANPKWIPRDQYVQQVAHAEEDMRVNVGNYQEIMELIRSEEGKTPLDLEFIRKQRVRLSKTMDNLACVFGIMLRLLKSIKVESMQEALEASRALMHERMLLMLEELKCK